MWQKRAWQRRVWVIKPSEAWNGISKGLGRSSSAPTQDQIALEGPWKREESCALNYTFRGD